MKLLGHWLVLLLAFTAGCSGPNAATAASKSPSPALSPVGNSGQLTILEPEPGGTFSVQSAIWNKEKLIVTGEELDFILVFLAPELKETLTLDSQAKPLASPNYVAHPKEASPRPADQRYESHQIESGTLKIVSVTGTGPWEIDGEVILDGKPGHLEGTLKFRVDPSPEPTASP